MKRILTVLIIAVLMALCVLSCRQASTVVQNPNQIEAALCLPTYASRFDYFWRALNSHYVFWDIDTTDWDTVYKTYLPKFEGMDKQVSTASDEEKEKVLSETFMLAAFNYMVLTNTLIDHHMNFTVFDPYRTGIKFNICPYDKEIQSRDYYHPKLTTAKSESGNIACDWSEGTEIVSYFTEGGAGGTADGYKTAVNLAQADEIAVKYMEKYNPETKEGTAATDDVVLEYCIAYDFTIDKMSSDMHVIYLAISSYSVSAWIETYENSPEVCPSDTDEAFAWKAGKTLLSFFKTVRQYYDSKNLAGIILDNRGNSGGNPEDLSYLIGLYTGEPFTLYYSKNKEGFGKTDYSSEVPGTISPNTAKSEYYCDLVSADIPYVVLVDLHSISCGELSTTGISSMKNGYVIGERTFGATGAIFADPAMLTITYGGTFGDAEKGPVFAYTAAWNTKLYTRDGYKSLEGYGVTPDKEIYFKSTGDDIAEDVQTMLKSQVQETFRYIAAY